MKSFEITDTVKALEYIDKNIKKEYQLYLIAEGERLTVCNKCEYLVCFSEENENTVLLRSFRYNPDVKTYFDAVKEAYIKVKGIDLDLPETSELYIIDLKEFGFEPVIKDVIKDRQIVQKITNKTPIKTVKNLSTLQRIELKRLIKKINKQTTLINEVAQINKHVAD